MSFKRNRRDLSSATDARGTHRHEAFCSARSADNPTFCSLSACAVRLREPDRTAGAPRPNLCAVTEFGHGFRRSETCIPMAVSRPETTASLATDRIALRRDLTLDYYAGAQWNDAAPR